MTEVWKSIAETRTIKGVFWRESKAVVNLDVRWCCEVHPEAWDETMSGKVCSNSFGVAAYLRMLRMLGTQDSGGVHPDVLLACQR